MSHSSTRYGLSDASAKRLDSYIVTIALTLKPNAPSITGTEGIRIGQRGSLLIRPDGSWHDFAGDVSGRGALPLIAHLLDSEQHDLNPVSTSRFAQRWLTEHSGDGDFQAAPFDPSQVTQEAKNNAAFAEQVLRTCQSLLGTEAEVYLKGRGLSAPFPPILAFYPNARVGDAALVGIRSMPDGRVAGVQLGYLDSYGRKSTVAPTRRSFLSELDPDKRRGSAFRIAATPVPEALNTTLGPADINPDDDEVYRRARNARKLADALLIVEGLEDCLSLHKAFPYSAIIGLPGINALKHQPAKANQIIVMVRDGDAADAQVNHALARGVDELLLQRASVRVTETPMKQNGAEKVDANLILQREGVEALQQLVLSAPAATLSLKGRIRQLAAQASLEYDQVRRQVAKEYGVRVTSLDQQVAALRTPENLAEEDPFYEEPHPEPVPDIAVPLDASMALLKRLVIADEVTLATCCVWALHSHFVHHESIKLFVTPRLLISAPGENCGKSTLLESVLWCSARGRPVGNPTASSVFRTMAAWHPTLCIDEADKLFRGGRNVTLLEIINLGYRRTFSKIARTEETRDGQREQVLFDCWGAIAMAMVGQLSEATTQSRCTMVELRRALATETVEHLEAGEDEAQFAPIRRQFARFAQDLAALPTISRPKELANRTGDNWKPLLQLAELAGPRWVRLITAAAMCDAQRQGSVGSLVPLLTDIRSVFGTKVRLSTKQLINSLLQLDDRSAEWDRVNRGGPITDVWLARRLKGVLQTKDAEGHALPRKWREGAQLHNGFQREHFADAFTRYLTDDTTEDGIITDVADTTAPSEPPTHPDTHPEASPRPGTPGTPGTPTNSSSYNKHLDSEKVFRVEKAEPEQPGTPPLEPGAPPVEPAHSGPAVPAAVPGVPGHSSKKSATRNRKTANNQLIDNEEYVAVPGVPGQTAVRTPFSQIFLDAPTGVAAQEQPQVEKLSAGAAAPAPGTSPRPNGASPAEDW